MNLDGLVRRAWKILTNDTKISTITLNEEAFLYETPLYIFSHLKYSTPLENIDIFGATFTIVYMSRERTRRQSFSRNNRYINVCSVIWKNIDYNIGNAYDASTGTFTCPFDGLYSFYATSLVVHGKNASVHINVNDAYTIYHHVSPGFAHASPYSVLKLKTGDRVHIKMIGYFYQASSKCARTYFQGRLIELLWIDCISINDNILKSRGFSVHIYLEPIVWNNGFI